jgi:hypothetical protein
VKGAIASPAITLFLPETLEYFQVLPEYSSHLRSNRKG